MSIRKKRKAVFLDRDGTINVDKQYVYKLEEFEFIPGALEGLKLLQEAGFLLIIITNQSGIARGYYTEEDYQKLNTHMLTLIEKHGVHISEVLYCPHHPEATVKKYRVTCNCRKPRLGLFYQAQKEWNIDFSASFAIGDKMRDLTICNETDCHGYLLKRGMETEIHCPRIEVKTSLLEVAKSIVEERQGE